jgi:type IV secretion system protein VirD4
MSKFILLLISLLALALALYALRWALLPRRRVPGNRVRSQRIRLWLRLHPGRGMATAFELWAGHGRFAAFRKSRHSRRSLSAWERIRRPDEHSIVVGRAHYRHGVRLPVEEHLVIVAPPRTGKSGTLATMIIHHPGTVLVTSTKEDMFTLTSGIRAQRGPVHVFNPEGIGSVPSTFRWDPVRGCADEATAIRRASAFAEAASTEGVEDAAFWSQSATAVLRALFCAAGLVRGDLRTVSQWAYGTNTERAVKILAAAGRDQWAASLAEFVFSPAAKTTSTIRLVLQGSLQFLADRNLAAAVLPADPFDSLDFEEFATSGGTLYAIAAAESKQAPLAGLFAALTSELRHAAIRVGSRMPGQRLDPPMLLALDEACQISPVPAPQWLQDSGGKGIQIVVVGHGEAQFKSRWKAEGCRTIFDTSAKLFLPGISDVDTLTTASKLAGQTAMRERGKDEKRSRHDVLTPDMVRALPKGHGLLLRGSMAPVIVRLPMAWKDSTYKKAVRAGTAVAAIEPARPPAIGGMPLFQLPIPESKAIAPDQAELLDDTNPADDSEPGDDNGTDGWWSR